MTSPLPSRQPQEVPSSPAMRWAFGTWSVVMAYYLSLFDRRWIPFDEGTLGQAAWRILQGEMPHRDFDAMYTGLLDYVNAAAMSVLGVHLLTPRLVMLAAVALWLPAVWSIARRLTGSAPAASGLTCMAMLIGPPIYPAAMPSWFNLYFATWGLWAALRWLDRDGPRWLFVAGVMAGLSILSKLTGLYLVAGLLFMVLHVEVVRSATVSEGGQARSRTATLLFAATTVASLLVMETLLVRSQMGVATLVNYVLPTAVVGAVLVRDATRVAPGWSTVIRTIRGWVTVVVGTFLAVTPFLAWYATRGGLDDLYRGLFVLPVERLSEVLIPVPDLTTTWTILIPTALVAASAFVGRGVALVMGVASLGAMIGLLTRLHGPLFVQLFSSMLLAVPVVAAAGGVAVMGSRQETRESAIPLMATLWVVTMIHLIRFPFAGPIYFAYVAPLAVVAAGGAMAIVIARLRTRGRVVRGRPLYLAVALAYAVFLVVGPNRGGIFSPLPPPPEAPLPLERGKIVVPLAEAREYLEMVQGVHRLTDGPYVYATPDAPEVTFLAGMENPTRTLFEVFEEETSRTERTMRALERHDVEVIVVNTRPFFSSMPADLAATLSAAYPTEVRIGRFRVRWRADVTP